MTVVRDQLFPQKPPGSRFRFSRTGVQPSPGSTTIELPSAFAESGAYPPDRELQGSPRQCSLSLACRHPPEGHQIGARKRRTPENTILSQPYCRRISTDRPNREGNQFAASLEMGPALHPPERPSHTHTAKPGFGGRGHEICMYIWSSHIIAQSMDQPGKVANPARGQLNRENVVVVVVVSSRVSLLISILRLNLRTVLNENQYFKIPSKFTNFLLPWVYIEA